MLSKTDSVFLFMVAIGVILGVSGPDLGVEGLELAKGYLVDLLQRVA
jgi:hypothetical protein